LAGLGEPQKASVLQIATAERLAELIRQDPSNKDWALLETSNLLHLAQTLIRQARDEEARQRLEIAIDKLSRSRSGADADRGLALGLILRAQMRTIGDEKAMEDCREAIRLLAPIRAGDPTSAYTLDLWVRANLCGGHRDQVQDAITWLTRIGYKDSDYLRVLSTYK
jgi:hypothetical protein